ncbi:MAG: hypothetical protein JOY90_29450 [Bradyrhizobium sp.]|uniref:hypothetical protein n=1 Tax=Bradyrhizobium sp. TaxID=376 RepID=UPI001D1EA15D|nr:hypothetical protein [Bradyrhizobium sp.]MBV9564537.1 hypothetical protein [Bradyrhizobium sp.]
MPASSRFGNRLRADRRLVASGSYAIQIAGSIAFIVAGGTGLPWLLLGVVLFGLGNGTFLPPLIVQAGFEGEDVGRVVTFIVAIAQGAYAFAPARVRSVAGCYGVRRRLRAVAVRGGRRASGPRDGSVPGRPALITYLVRADVRQASAAMPMARP